MDAKSELIQVLEQWKASLESGDLEGLLGLYARDANLWGTLSREIRNTPPKIREYFVSFIAHEDIHVEYEDFYTRVYGNTGICSGSYLFTWKESGKIASIPGRFTFVFQRKKDKWQIVEHHSSIKPELPFDLSKYLY